MRCWSRHLTHATHGVPVGEAAAQRPGGANGARRLLSLTCNISYRNQIHPQLFHSHMQQRPTSVRRLFLLARRARIPTHHTHKLHYNSWIESAIHMTAHCPLVKIYSHTHNIGGDAFPLTNTIIRSTPADRGCGRASASQTLCFPACVQPLKSPRCAASPTA